jgi:hypothetical protein
MHCSVALTKAVSHSECGLLVGLKGELLGEHYVPKGKMPYRTEAPSGDVGAVLTELFDIHVPAAANAIALPGVAAPHLKISMPFQCSPLLRAEPFVE